MRKIHQTLPKRGKRIDLRIEITTNKRWKQIAEPVFGDEYLDYAGAYFIQRMEIYVREDADEPVSTFVHEIGHHVYWQSLTNKEKDEWIKFWADHECCMPSEYATTNPSEGFAECYFQ